MKIRITNIAKNIKLKDLLVNDLTYQYKYLKSKWTLWFDIHWNFRRTQSNLSFHLGLCCLSHKFLYSCMWTGGLKFYVFCCCLVCSVIVSSLLINDFWMFVLVSFLPFFCKKLTLLYQINSEMYIACSLNYYVI